MGATYEGDVHSLEDDYAIFSTRGQRDDRDLCNGHLTDLLNQRLGVAASDLVEWEYLTIDGDDNVRIKVEPYAVPFYDKSRRSIHLLAPQHVRHP